MAITDTTRSLDYRWTGLSQFDTNSKLANTAGVEFGQFGQTDIFQGVFFAKTTDGLFLTTDGGLVATDQGTIITGSQCLIFGLEDQAPVPAAARSVLVDPSGILFDAPLPEPGWEASDTDTTNYDLGSGTGAGAYVEMVGLTITIPEDTLSTQRIDAFISAHAINKTLNRTGVVEFTIRFNGAIPAPADNGEKTLIGAGFDGSVTVLVTSTTHANLFLGDTLDVWARINDGNQAQFGVDLNGTPAPIHTLTASTPDIAAVASATITTASPTLNNATSVFLADDDTAGDDITLNIASPAEVEKGHFVFAKKLGTTGDVTLQTTTIDGVASLTLSEQFDAITLFSDGLEYRVFSFYRHFGASGFVLDFVEADWVHETGPAREELTILASAHKQGLSFMFQVWKLESGTFMMIKDLDEDFNIDAVTGDTVLMAGNNQQFDGKVMILNVYNPPG